MTKKEREIKFRFWDKGLKKFHFLTLDQYQIQTTGNPNEKWGELEPLQQYTGLKDKNGKEIYEGDILYDGMLDQQATIFWNISLKNDEVIGNIYENPELIEEK